MTTLERKLDKMLKVLEQNQEIERWVTEAIFRARTGKTARECETVRTKYPHLIRWESADKVGKNDRTIRRGPIYDYLGYINLHKPVLSNRN